MSVDAKRASMQRNAHRTNIKALLDKLNPLQQNVEANRLNLTVGMNKLVAYQAKLEKCNEIILDACDTDDRMAAEIKTASDYDDKLQDAICQLQALLSAPPMSTAAPIADSQNSTAATERRVKLPKLELPKFSGDPLQFQEWWDSFKTTIHENSVLPDIDKFKYLKLFLEGDALRLAEGYMLTAANYSTVVEVLKDRFGSTQLATFAHITAMLELPTASHDQAQLQKTFDDCERHIRSLVALGLEENTFGQFFTPIILNKLPTYVKIELHRANGARPWTLENLRNLLKEEIRARDLSHRQFGELSANPTKDGKAHKPEQRQQQQQFSSKQKPRTSGALLPATGSTGAEPKGCLFCGGSHASDLCRKFPDYESRRKFLCKKCHCCLRDGHPARNCRSKRQCSHCGAYSHHSVLCFKLFDRDKPAAAQTSSGNQMAVHGRGVMRYTNMQTAVAQVQGPSGATLRVRALLDTAGYRSFITWDVCKAVGAKIVGEEMVDLGVFGMYVRKQRRYKIAQIDIVTPSGHKIQILANVADYITPAIHRIPLEIDKYQSLRSLPLAETHLESDQPLSIDMLIGGDYYYDIVTSEQIRYSNGVVVLSSVLGYVVAGSVPGLQSNTWVKQSALFLSGSHVAEHGDCLERLWSLEKIGIRDPPDRKDDELALAKFNATVMQENGRYQVQFPWKIDNPELPDNYYLAKARLKGLVQKVSGQPEVLQKYDDTISDQVERGIIEPAPVDPTGKLVHYIPHHCVITPHKTTKLRIVYDASARRSQGHSSLNDCLYRGPVILPQLCGMLIRFRMSRIVLTADIEKAFLQVGLQQCDRDVTRFLWLRDINKPLVPENLQVYRFCRIPFGIVSSPFLLGATVLHHLSKYSSPAVQMIAKNIYVDNVICSASDTKGACEVYKVAKPVFADACMNLREWYSNDSGFLDSVPEADRGSGDITKVLGMQWNTQTDMISCKTELPIDAKLTKRGILADVNQIYDPCGLFVPVTLGAKLLLQGIWKERLDWDSPLPLTTRESWFDIRKSLQILRGHEIPRFPFTGNPNDGVVLHCFCDASAKAYAAAVFVQCSTGSCHLVYAKSRVSPVNKNLTIPRLELLAVLIGVRALQYVSKEIGVSITATHLWSDSKCVLHWLNTRQVLTMFVENRMKEIRAASGVRFHYVASAENPADIASRGCGIDTLRNHSLWWKGPPWLADSEREWPAFECKSPEGFEDLEVRKQQVVVHSVTVCQPFIDYTRFSNLSRLLGVLGWMQRFKLALQRKQHDTGPLTADEVHSAKLLLISMVQQESFPAVWAGKTDSSTRNLVNQLSLFKDNGGFIRSRGRLGLARCGQEGNCPTLLPRDHPVTRLIIMDCHAKVFHHGTAHTLSKVNELYRVISGRSQVASVIKQCRLCRILRAKSFAVPKAPDLPSFRVSQSEPFQCVGLDYLGPLYIKAGEATESKVWICLFTCAVTRAIHLEVVEDLTTEQFLLSLRRHSALYGFPRIIVSDNAKHFHSADKAIVKIWQEVRLDNRVKEFSALNGISWKFITEKAPWMGGFYERLISLAKCSLKACLTGRKVTLVELQTLAAEISAVLNTRPLVPIDSDDVVLSLCPADFLIRTVGSRHPVFGPSDDNEQQDPNYETPTASDGLVLKWKRLNRLLDHFWQIWHNQYLTGLRERWLPGKQRNVQQIEPTLGMTVIVKTDGPRSTWQLGRIVRLYPSLDDQIRSVLVRVANGHLIKRPIKLLCPLEACVEIEKQQTAMQPQVARETRNAARAAQQKIHQLLAEEAEHSE